MLKNLSDRLTIEEMYFGPENGSAFAVLVDEKQVLLLASTSTSAALAAQTSIITERDKVKLLHYTEV